MRSAHRGTSLVTVEGPSLVNGLRYEDVLDQQRNPAVREVCTDEDGFADVLADALKDHAAPQDVLVAARLAGNISRF